MGNSDETTRLSISGVRSRVALHVAERRDSQVTLEQKLPFLAIGTEVADENGRTGRIARVAVALERGVPKLVLELSYDPRPTRARGDETISYDQRAQAALAQDQRPTVPEPLRPRRIELDPEGAAERSRPLAVAFPLETKRPASPLVRASWLSRLFAPLAAMMGSRPS